MANALKRTNKVPKIIILGTNPKMFSFKAKPGKYTPLIIDDISLHLKLINNSEKKDYQSIFPKSINEGYLFKSIFNRLLGKKYKPTRQIENSYNGYLEVHNQIENVEWDKFSTLKENTKINKNQITYFEKIISLARENNVKLCIVNPPIWEKKQSLHYDGSECYAIFEDKIEYYSKKFKIPVYNYTNNDLIKSDFLNTEHLNYFGAIKFTYGLSDWINKTLTPEFKKQIF